MVSKANQVLARLGVIGNRDLAEGMWVGPELPSHAGAEEAWPAFLCCLGSYGHSQCL